VLTVVYLYMSISQSMHITHVVHLSETAVTDWVILDLIVMIQ